MPAKRAGDSDSGAQKRVHAPMPDASGAKKKSSTRTAPGDSADKGGADKNVKTTHTNLAQGKAANPYNSNDNFSQEVIFHYLSAE
jgi:hypothetical protein